MYRATCLKYPSRSGKSNDQEYGRPGLSSRSMVTNGDAATNEEAGSAGADGVHGESRMSFFTTVLMLLSDATAAPNFETLSTIKYPRTNSLSKVREEDLQVLKCYLLHLFFHPTWLHSTVSTWPPPRIRVSTWLPPWFRVLTWPPPRIWVPIWIQLRFRVSTLLPPQLRLSNVRRRVSRRWDS